MLANLDVFGQLSYHENIAQALRYQIQADSMQRLVEASVLALSTTPNTMKEEMRTAMRDAEAQAKALQEKANEWFSQAATLQEATVSTSSCCDVSSVVHVSEFAILPKSPYSAANPAPIDQPLPDGVVYKIQLGAFSRPLAPNTFRGLTPISGEKLDNGLTKYYVGFFTQFVDAADALRIVHQYGFNDAFIIAFFNRRTIHLDRAKQLEKI